MDRRVGIMDDGVFDHDLPVCLHDGRTALLRLSNSRYVV